MGNWGMGHGKFKIIPVSKNNVILDEIETHIP
jgi:hypothetical protein